MLTDFRVAVVQQVRELVGGDFQVATITDPHLPDMGAKEAAGLARLEMFLTLEDSLAQGLQQWSQDALARDRGFTGNGARGRSRLIFDEPNEGFTRRCSAGFLKTE